MESKDAALEIEDLIGKPPGWLLKSGISVIAVVIITFLLTASFVKYPDKINSTGIMTSDTPPIEHFTFTSGIIDSIFANENDTVRAGNRLVLIQNPCRTTDLDNLKSFIAAFEMIDEIPEYFTLKFPMNLQLGELQSDYARLQLTYSEFTIKLKSTDFKRRREILESEIENLKMLNILLKKQVRLADSELQIVMKDNNRNQHLRSIGVISDVDLEKSDKELLTFKKGHASLENAVIENEIRQQELKLEIERLIRERTDFENDYLLKLKEIVSVLRQNIAAWEEKYFVMAKVNGKVSFQSALVKKSRVMADQHVLSILPGEYSSRKFVRAIASEIGIGKVKIGDKAILKIDQYPHKEFGVMYSTIISISPLPKKDNNGNHLYELIIPLPDKMLTTYKKSIPFRPNTGIQAEIITEDKSIIERVMNEFLNLTKNV